MKQVLSIGPSKIAVAIAIVVIVGLQLLLARPILDQLLLDSVRSPAAKWASYLLDEVSRSMHRAEEGSGLTDEEQAVMAGSIGSALATTTVQQLDLIRLDCMCAVSVGQGLLTTNAQGDALSISDALDMVLNAAIPNGRVIGFGDDLIELDAARLDDVVASGRPFLAVLDGRDLASAIFVSARKDQPLVMVRLLMDLSDKASTLKLMLGMLAIITTGGSVLVLFFAMRAVEHTKREGEMTAEQARFLAERDPLTHLFNRLGFRNRAAAFLDRCDRNGNRACLVQYDADNLKSINDLHGHPTGDRCLADIAEQLRQVFPNGLIARLGSDEFAVLVEEDKLSDRIQPVTGQTTDAAARDLAISTTVGFAFYPDDGPTLTS